jgi:hypothetical protein
MTGQYRNLRDLLGNSPSVVITNPKNTLFDIGAIGELTHITRGEFPIQVWAVTKTNRGWINIENVEVINDSKSIN